jgi:hypothetical protein
MTTTTAAPIARRSLHWTKIAAVVAWLGGVFTTYLFLHVAMPELSIVAAVVIAGALQWTLTLAERPLWRALLKRSGGRMAGVAVVVTILDALLNAAGVYPFMSRLAQTGLGQMLSEVFGVQPTMGTRAAFLVAFLLGLLAASLPEALWES